MFSTEFKEELEDGKVLLFSRNGIFQARFYKGDRQYIFKSLKTRKVEEARKLAVKYLYEMEFKQREGLPLQQKSFNDVIDEYIARVRYGLLKRYMWNLLLMCQRTNQSNLHSHCFTRSAMKGLQLIR